MVVLSEGNRSRPLQVGLYELTKTLGRGNFAVVKLAFHKVTKTQVAIKIIDKTKLSEADLQKVYREVHIMKQLNHPYIIKLYQVMETKDMLYMVLEYAKNGELFDYLSCSGRLSEMEARKKFWQILQAVEYCHKNDIVHRDLKAENLLLDANMDLKLADFGFGNFYSERGAMSTWCGSPPYAAPEVFEGRNYQGPAVDIWSLGVVLYVMVCGSLPFDGPSLPTLRQRVLDGRFRIPFFMSHDCENLIRRMLSMDPSRRITMAQIKDHSWLHSDLPTVHQTPHQSLSLADRPGPLCPEGEARQGRYSESVLAVMQTLGVDRQKTIESLDNKSYNHFSGIYWLLLEQVNDLHGHRRSEATEDPRRGAATGPIHTATDEDEEGRPSDSGEEEEQEEEEGGAPCSGISGTNSRRHAFAAVPGRMQRQTPLSSFDDASSDSCRSSSCCSSSSCSSSSSSPRHSPPPSPSPPVSTAASGGATGGSPAGSPAAMAGPPRAPLHGLPVPGFEECHRASDSSSLDMRVFQQQQQQQLRREARSKGLLGLNQIGTDGPMDPQQDWSPDPGPQRSISPQRPTCVPIPVHNLLQRNIPNQRVAQSPPRHHHLLLLSPHKALPLLMVPPPPPVAAPAPPRHLRQELLDSSRPCPSACQYLSLSPRPNGQQDPLPSTQTFQPACTDQPLDLSRSASSTSSSSAFVDSAVLLLESHLHIKSEDLRQAGYTNMANVHVYPQSSSSQPRPCRPGQALLKAQPSPLHPIPTAVWQEDRYGPNIYMGSTQS